MQMQSLPLEAKIRMTELRIRWWYEYFDGNVYVSVSGGKDSQVLAHIVKKLYPDVPLVFINTGLENESVRMKGLDIADKVLYPKKSFLQVITQYGYPIVSKEVAQAIYECQKANESGKQMPEYRLEKLEGRKINKDGTKSAYNMEKWKFLLDAPFRISHLCCNYSKKEPAKRYEKETGRKAFLGTLAEESRLRTSKWIKYGCNAFEEKRPTSQPLSFWTEQDILQYIKKNQIKIAEIYGNIVCTDNDGMEYDNDLFGIGKLKTTGAERTGCCYCLFGITHDKERLLRLKETEPQKYDYVMRGGKFDDKGFWVPHNGLGYKYVVDWLNEHGNLDMKY